MEKFRKLLVWQKAHDLCLWVYRMTSIFPHHEQFGLTAQMRRNGVSIPSNVAEGSKRASLADRRHFNVIADGSLEELKYQVLLAHDLGYISDAVRDEGMERCREVGRMLHGYTVNMRA